MSKNNYKRLTYSERVKIETFIAEKRSKSYIAQQLKRSRSTIAREINKWVIQPSDQYSAQLAHWYAYEDAINKKNQSKIDQFPKLKIFIYRGLLQQWTPEQISGVIKLIYPNDPIMSISHEAIYQHIYAQPQAKKNLKLIALLTRKKRFRKSIKGSKKRKIKIKDRTTIDLRPNSVEQRIEIGHWEGDLMIGVKHGSAIGTLVERKTRYTYIVKLGGRSSLNVVNSFSKTINQLESKWRKTLTYDNGVEMAKHKHFTQKTGMNVYFANPYSSWERGTNENTNGLIRRYLPKGTNFNQISQQILMDIQYKLNNRPRKILGYKTPNQMMKAEA